MTDGYGFVESALTDDQKTWNGWGSDLKKVADGIPPMPALADTFTTLPFADAFRAQFATSRQLLIDYIADGADDYTAIGTRLGWVVGRYTEADNAAVAIIDPLVAELGA